MSDRRHSRLSRREGTSSRGHRHRFERHDRSSSDRTPPNQFESSDARIERLERGMELMRMAFSQVMDMIAFALGDSVWLAGIPGWPYIRHATSFISSQPTTHPQN